MRFERFYKDNVSGKIDNARFAKCSSSMRGNRGERRADQSSATGAEKEGRDADGYGPFLEMVFRLHRSYDHDQAHGCRVR